MPLVPLCHVFAVHVWVLFLLCPIPPFQHSYYSYVFLLWLITIVCLECAHVLPNATINWGRHWVCMQ